MQLSELIEEINKLLPPDTAMENDRLGLQIQLTDKVKRLLVVYELTEKTIDEAIDYKADSIITFHPLIYQPLQKINQNDRVGKLTTQLIQNNINLISIHTTFDAFRFGTSYLLAEQLNLKIIDFLVPDNIRENSGMGVIAEPPVELTENELLANIYNICHSPLKYNQGKENTKIKRIGILGGSGSSFLKYAMRADLDAFITADITYHVFHSTNGKMMLIDPGHYETEQFLINGLCKLLTENIGEKYSLEFLQTSVYTNPVRYYPNTDFFINEQEKFLNNYKKKV